MEQVVVAGGTGYLGRPLIEKLCADGFQVSAVVRPRSAARIPACCRAIAGDALDSRSYQDQVPAGSTFVHLVGVAHPAPWKAAEFRSIDLGSLEQSLEAAQRAAVGRFVFVSVAHPAPVMKAFIEVRMQCEQRIRDSGLNATILRPWYVLGPGHYWPYVLIPFYKVLEAIPASRPGAVRLGLVSRSEMVNALAAVVASKGSGIRIVETAGIRALGSNPSDRSIMERV